MAPRSSRLRLMWCLLVPLLLVPVPARADSAMEASEKVYEAADSIDAARGEAQAGRAEQADRLLVEAERLLREAATLDPDLARVGYEQARIHLLRDKPTQAQAALKTAMKLELPTGEHVRMAELLDTVRSDLGRPSLGVQWRRDTAMRDAGIGVLAGGAVLTALGMVVAYVSFAGAAEDGVTEDNLSLNRFGWALAGVGGGITLGGGALTVAGEVRLGGLRRILPGPWRLTERATGSSFVVALRWSLP